MVMPCQTIRAMVFGAAPVVTCDNEESPIEESQIQPASLDFRLGKQVSCVRSAGLPHESSVKKLIDRKQKYDFELHAGRLNRLEKGNTYIVPLLERCDLPDNVFLEFSPKSSTGRTDVFVRVLCDNHPHYDTTPPGYRGPLYLEITPLSFDVLVRHGLSLVQGRFKRVQSSRLSDDEIRRLHITQGIMFGRDGKPLGQKELRVHDSELYYHIDLDRDIVGFVAKQTKTDALNLTVSGDAKLHRPADFWEPDSRTLLPARDRGAYPYTTLRVRADPYLQAHDRRNPAALRRFLRSGFRS
jgi:dCTP deaminase